MPLLRPRVKGNDERSLSRTENIVIEVIVGLLFPTILGGAFYYFTRDPAAVAIVLGTYLFTEIVSNARKKYPKKV